MLIYFFSLSLRQYWALDVKFQAPLFWKSITRPSLHNNVKNHELARSWKNWRVIGYIISIHITFFPAEYSFTTSLPTVWGEYSELARQGQMYKGMIWLSITNERYDEWCKYKNKVAVGKWQIERSFDLEFTPTWAMKAWLLRYLGDFLLDISEYCWHLAAEVLFTFYETHSPNVQ
jgi:hypothetical protein